MNPQKVITRFAPSPTGLLHGGNYRTAVFAYLFARKTGGEFIVRIEDTDTVRSKKEYEENILEALDWLGLQHSQLFRQSEHQPRHTVELQRLIENGHAYVSKETPTEEGQRTEVIRFRNPNEPVAFTDVIRGLISVDTTDLGDFVIARSLTEPVFHFAVVVDDADEGVTHVIRGEDHISNTPRQVLIQRALGYETPKYAHLPLVLGPDKAKLSKRRGAKALTQYRDEGFLPEAMINYLALLGWHPEGEQEIFTLDDLVEVFTLERIQKSAGIFDEVKLRWFNHEHIKRLTDAEFVARMEEFASKSAVGELPAYFPKVAGLLRERVETLLEAQNALLEGEFSFMEPTITYEPELLIKSAKANAEIVKKHLVSVHEMFSNILSLDGEPDTSEFTADVAKAVVFPYATEEGRASVLWPLRVALSGKEKSPDPFTLCGLLGKEVVQSRIEQALQLL